MSNNLETKESRILVDRSANPAPLGLVSFGMTTVLLNLHNIGLFEMNAMILGMGFFFGGLAQVIAGKQESKKGNTFAATAFTSYGMFWLSLVAVFLLPSIGIAKSASAFSMGFYLLLWGIFTFGMFIGTLKLKKALRVVFGSLALLFFLLALKDFTESHVICLIAGFVGIFCGLSAIYTAFGEVLNEVYDTTILPID